MVPVSTMMGEEERPKSAGKGMGLKGVGIVSRLVWLVGWLAFFWVWAGLSVGVAEWRGFVRARLRDEKDG